jgi:hypothetical protein
MDPPLDPPWTPPPLADHRSRAARVHPTANDGCPTATANGDCRRRRVPTERRRVPTDAVRSACVAAWKNVDTSIRAGASTVAFDALFGMSVWEWYTRHPPKEHAFAHFMSGVSNEPNAAVATSGANFSECTGLVDVGGGHGSLLADVVTRHTPLRPARCQSAPRTAHPSASPLLRSPGRALALGPSAIDVRVHRPDQVAAYPTLKGDATVVDLPSVVSSAPARDGISFVGGDFFDAATVPSRPLPETHT